MRRLLALLLLLSGMLTSPHTATCRSGPASGAEPIAPPLAPLPKDSALTEAYLDAYGILRRENTCSAFYGGAAASLLVLNRMVGSIRKEPLGDVMVGMRMSGSITYNKDTTTGVQYRLFGEMKLNARGVFYDRSLLRTPKSWHDPFLARSAVREVRVIVLLHELAHLVEGPDGRWLIPDDGGNPRQSARNTMTVMERCGRHVSALKDGAGE
jgi:hypothetical protein